MLPLAAETEPNEPVLLTTKVSIYPVGPVKLPAILTSELKVAGALVVRVLKLAAAPVKVPAMAASPLDLSVSKEPVPEQATVVALRDDVVKESKEPVPPVREAMLPLLEAILPPRSSMFPHTLVRTCVPT